MKLVMVQNQPETPEYRVQATYILLNPRTGRPVLTVPANYLTDLRTAATSAVATKVLACEDARVLGVFGTGRQARAHIQVLRSIRRFEQVLVCGREPAAGRDFAQRMSSEINLPVEPADARTCAAESDVICACTTSQSRCSTAGSSGRHSPEPGRRISAACARSRFRDGAALTGFR